MTSTLLTVPRPGRCRSGTQASRTTAPTTTDDTPSVMPVLRAIPWSSTLHGISPSSERASRAMDRPYSASPA